ncbi:hypothetical protein BS47DRAFT_1453468 [Hydnum rufescens UP504]|uniref:Uncharacterized protein n=1 Tax=Hydnum rufescens UP504 TaxID=1448309 RepID=A0A9P6AZ67_9AGAM|nr:hypothetical protein BS47DRAFT_1453468 [Hydnum rufescens UP504]
MPGKCRRLDEYGCSLPYHGLSPEPPAKQTPSLRNDNAMCQGTPPRRNPGLRTHNRVTGTPDEPHPLWQVCDNSKMVKQNDNLPNKPAQHPPGNDDATHQNNTCQTKHANDDWPDQTQESTTHPLWRVCGNFKSSKPTQLGTTSGADNELAEMAENWPKIGRKLGLRESQTCSGPYGLIGDNMFHL